MLEVPYLPYVPRRQLFEIIHTEACKFFNSMEVCPVYVLPWTWVALYRSQPLVKVNLCLEYPPLCKVTLRVSREVGIVDSVCRFVKPCPKYFTSFRDGTLRRGRFVPCVRELPCATVGWDAATSEKLLLLLLLIPPRPHYLSSFISTFLANQCCLFRLHHRGRCSRRS